MRRRSSSTSSTMTSTSWPVCTTFAGLTFLLVQSISETCTRPSTPSSIRSDAATLFVDVEHHDLDFLAGVHHLRRVDVLVGPVHFRDVHEAFDAVLDQIGCGDALRRRRAP